MRQMEEREDVSALGVLWAVEVCLVSINTDADQKMMQMIIINAQENGMILLHFSLKGIRRRKAQFELVKSSAKYSLLETAINLYISMYILPSQCILTPSNTYTAHLIGIDT